jgi:hypothetical protein
MFDRRSYVGCWAFGAMYVGLCYEAIVVALCPRRIVGDRRGASGTLALQSVE